MEEWCSGGLVEWWSGRVMEWRSGGVVVWWNGGMALRIQMRESQESGSGENSGAQI